MNWANIRQATEEDLALQRVKKYCSTRWPKAQKNVPCDVQSYWPSRDTLHTADGIVFGSDRIVIPVRLRSHMLNLIDQSHFGMEKCKAKARQLVYWPRMTADIERTISACDTCAKFQCSPQREPMIPYSIPPNRFEKVAMDIMTWCGQDYLVMVDYYSKYPELLPLQDKTAKTIVEHTKSVCARHSIPMEIV